MIRLLLVEDNEMNIDMISRRLERRGYAVSVARNGAEALIAAAEDAPDLILMDMSLPDMNGVDVTRELRTSGPSQSIPIIMLTAHAREQDRKLAMAAGCDEFETKPVDFKLLVQKIDSLLSG